MPGWRGCNSTPRAFVDPLPSDAGGAWSPWLSGGTPDVLRSGACVTDSGRGLADVWHPYRSGSTSFSDIASWIHVWRIGLDGRDGQVGDNLSAEDVARAERLTRRDDRRRFIAARSLLRRTLADVRGVVDDPNGAALRIGYGPAGKPFLVDDPQLHFNVSHSDDLAVLAVTRVGDVGIDVERQRATDDRGDVARLVFDEAERAALLACPAAERDSVFYRLWTRKEAVLKAMGTGIPVLTARDAASLTHAGAAWLVTSLPPLDGYAAALARPRNAHGVRLWSCSPDAMLRSVGR